MADYLYKLFEDRISPPSPKRSESFQHKYIYDSRFSCLCKATSKGRNTSLLQIKNYSDIQNKIIPFFNKYPILGIKSLDFNDFKIVANLIKNKEHLTAKSFNQVIEIVNRMNLDRNFDSSIEKKN